MEMLDGASFNSVVPIWEHIVLACNSAKIEKFIIILFLVAAMFFLQL
jgi:hypothetical protein